jgi:hypothetical protein
VSELPEIDGSRISISHPTEEAAGIDARVHDASPVGIVDEELDRSLRPTTLDDFVNQAQVTDQLRIFIEAARLRLPSSSPPSWACPWSRPPAQPWSERPTSLPF